MAKGRRPIAAIFGALVKWLVISAIAVVVSVAVMGISPILGVSLMLVFSGFMIVRTSRRDMPLNRVTALLPGAMALFCYVLQLAVAGIDDPTGPLVGVVVGLPVGWLIGRSHRIYVKDRQVFAHRTSGTILLWVLTYLVSQGATLIGLRQIAAVALGLGGFSTVVVVVLSVMLFQRAARLAPRRGAPIGATASWLLLAGLAAALAAAPLPDVRARAAVTVGNALEGLTYIVQHMSAPLPQTVGPSAKDISGTQGMTADSSAASVIFKGGQQTEVVENAFVSVMLAYAPALEGRQQRIIGEMLADTKCQAVSAPANALIAICEGSNFPENFFVTVLEGKWSAQVAVGLPGGINTNRAQVRQTAINVSVEVARLMGDLVYGSGSGGIVRPIVPVGTDFGDMVNRIVSVLTGGGHIPDEALAAGVAAAVAQLLAGIGMAVATAAAQAAAAAAQAAATQAAASGGGTRILDGDAALAWLRDHGYIKPDGQHTDRFDDFTRSLPSEAAPGLQGYAGDIDGNGNPSGEIAIVVDDEAPPPDDLGPPEEPVEPEPPVEPETPPEEEGPPPEEHAPPPPEEEAPPPPITIKEPLPPEKEPPKDEVKLEKPPCHDQIVRFDEACDECEKLLDEVHRLTLEKNALFRAMENKVISTGLCAAVDFANVLTTAATAPLKTFLGSTTASILSTVGFETLKYNIRSYFAQNPDIVNSLVSGAPSAGAAGGAGIGGAALDKIVEAGAGTAAEREALEAGTGISRVRGLGAYAQEIVTGFMGGRDVGNAAFHEYPALRQRYDTVVKLRDNSRRILDQAVKRRDAANRLMDDCLKRGT